MVLFDGHGKHLRTAPLKIKEGAVKCVAIGPVGKIAAGYVGRDVGCGVVFFDAWGKRLLSGPLPVNEGIVKCVAIEPDGRIAVGYRTDLGDSGVIFFDASGDTGGTRTIRGQGGRSHKLGVRAKWQACRGFSSQTLRRWRRSCALRRQAQTAPSCAAGSQ